MPRERKIFYGWWIVLAGATLNLIAGGTFFYGFTVFFNPIRETFGWGAAITSVAVGFRGLETGILDPIAGLLVDRMGPRKLVLFGWFIVGLGFLLMSRINSLWAFYGSFVLVSTGTCFGCALVLSTAVAHWFTRKRSRAMALTYLGFGASGILVPLLALSISQFEWRTTLVIVGIASWVIGIPLSLFMRHKPGQYGYLADGEPSLTIYETTSVPKLRSPGETMKPDSGSSATGFTAKAAMRTRVFWLLSFAFFFQHIASNAVNVHIVPYLESVKVPTMIAATAVTGMTLCSLIGRLGFGFLGDFTNKRYLVVIAFALQGLGLFIFSFIDMDIAWLLVPSLLIYAPGFGGPIPLKPALVADYFGISSFGTIFGWVSLISGLGGIVSPIIAGWIFDVTGDYRLAWQLFALVTVPGIPLMLLARPQELNKKQKP